ncbi:hypothetical protein SeMB42_g00191 [Synchytrium endobioticum]|uniref:MATH domain-containing protein n=1 Tax=Synchytrium endobioticum TaxID=286115 RepID=A0A507DTR6_9FUNG|nr:hypothetical protein SeMB42_g00191 [Synchytrium endobioticum]
MPKVISSSTVSSKTAQDTSSSHIRVYYCRFCSEFILIIDTALHNLPRRTTDSACIISAHRAAKWNTKNGAVRILKRHNGYEKQYRRACPRCQLPVGYTVSTDPEYTYVVPDALTIEDPNLPAEGTDATPGVQPMAREIGRIHYECVVFTWRIDRIDFATDMYLSPAFFVADFPFRMLLYPQLLVESKQGRFLGLFLQSDRHAQGPLSDQISVAWSVTLRERDSAHAVVQRDYEQVFGGEIDNWGDEEFMSQQDFVDAVKSDAVTFEISANLTKMVANPPPLSRLFMKEDMADVNLATLGRNGPPLIPAHSLLLKNSSSVFRDIVFRGQTAGGMATQNEAEESPWKDGSTKARLDDLMNGASGYNSTHHTRSTIKLEYSSKCVTHLLAYIYGLERQDYVPFGSDEYELRMECLRASDFYDLPMYNELVKEIACRDLTTERVLEVLSFSENHPRDDYSLKTTCLHFIAKHSKTVVASKEYKEWSETEENLPLIKDILEAVVA